MGIIKIENLEFAYDKEKVLNNINLEIKQGEFVGIVGATGCGKSTFAFCLNGIIPHSIQGTFSGNVFIDGQNTNSSNVANLSKKVGLVFQDPDSQIFALTVVDEIAFGLENQGISKEKIKTKVNQVLYNIRIDNLKERETYTLSFGQKQKVCIASILALDPDVLVLDEPTAQLDYKDTREIYKILGKLNQQGKTIILIEHKSDWLARYVSRILVLNNAKFELDGKPEEVFNHTDYLEKIGLKVPDLILLEKRLKQSNSKSSEITNIIKEINGKV